MPKYFEYVGRPTRIASIRTALVDTSDWQRPPGRPAQRIASKERNMFSEADVAVKDIVDAMPLLQLPKAERSVVFTPGAPLDFYGNGDGKLHANGREFDIKGINW